MSRALVLTASAAALVSTISGLRDGVPRLETSREQWSALAPARRDEANATRHVFTEAVWRRLTSAVGDDDRYAVVADTIDQHEVRNYAAYRLLPAIQVQDPDEADVVVYYKGTPGRPGCDPIATDVCVVRRET